MNIVTLNSMKRLYENGRVTKEDIIYRVVNGTLTTEEYLKITGEVYEG